MLCSQLSLLSTKKTHTHAVPARLCSRPVPIETEPQDPCGFALSASLRSIWARPRTTRQSCSLPWPAAWTQVNRERCWSARWGRPDRALRLPEAFTALSFVAQAEAHWCWDHDAMQHRWCRSIWQVLSTAFISYHRAHSELNICLELSSLSQKSIISSPTAKL